MSHPDFEIAIEKQAHGALTADQSQNLTDHLVHCEDCRRFQTTVLTTEQTMNAMTQQLETTIPWDMVHKKAVQGKRRFVYEGLVYAGLGTALSLAAVNAWLNTYKLSSLAFFAFPALAFLLLTARAVFGVVRAPTGGPLAAARREIRLTLRETRAWQWVLGFLFLASLRHDPFLAAFSLVGILALYWYRVLPLSRELRGLGDEQK
ncbi:MAG: hypothetical protein K1X64_21180 [Myxococcaceae bacterium]|nr:hypothetical protein [Myxococcaceae bacterium]